MRNAFAQEITELATLNEEIVLLSGDIGNKLFDNFKLRQGNRFLNCGIAEANMIGVAAGLAMNGLKPFVYTIAPFTTFRCLEQIKIDMGYHNAPVTIVGTGSGLSYASLGTTHHSLEDIAVIRCIPKMRVFAPCDQNELKAVLRSVIKHPGPSYIRIGKKGEPIIHPTIPNLEIGKNIIIKNGIDLTILCSGTLLAEASEACELLAKKGVVAELVSCPSIKPFDRKYLIEAASKFKNIVTLEEHSIRGGFGSLVAEEKSILGLEFNHILLGTGDNFIHDIGSQKYVRKSFGLLADQLVEKIMKNIT